MLLSDYCVEAIIFAMVMGETCVQSITAIRTTIIVTEAIFVTMAMVVMGGMCVQSITAIRTIIRLLCWK